MVDKPSENKAPVEAFLEAWWKDLQELNFRELKEYLALFPGDDEGIAREFLSLKTGVRDADANARTIEQEDLIGAYRIMGELGRGGQGVVYLAQDTRLHRKVALKVLSMLGARSEEALERFHREAEVASKLDHPGICAVYEAGVENGIQYIAMRLIEGASLAAFIGEERDRLETGGRCRGTPASQA